ncbi:ParB/RepB/Spo0J family partition protein [Streptomyces sp. NPDC005322]|uniref:ParB/RepB/Spo0J family partition protein n=1 Tax=Streptomyces sp. NPDC005322 TaxID=3157032 RepID=UPI0033AF45FB
MTATLPDALTPRRSGVPCPTGLVGHTLGLGPEDGGFADQPRKFFGEDAHRELSESIKENGLLQPAVVRTVKGEEAPHMIVTGERRWRACKAAGLTALHARILQDIDEE